MACTAPGAASVFLQKRSHVTGGENQNTAHGIPEQLFQLFG